MFLTLQIIQTNHLYVNHKTRRVKELIGDSKYSIVVQIIRKVTALVFVAALIESNCYD